MMLHVDQVSTSNWLGQITVCKRRRTIKCFDWISISADSDEQGQDRQSGFIKMWFNQHDKLQFCPDPAVDSGAEANMVKT